MGKIYIEFENQLKQSPIIIPLTNSSQEEAGEDYVYNKYGVMQTSIYGIKVPLIQINNIVVDFVDVISFSLKSVGHVPTVKLEVFDRYNLIKTFNTPGNDNELRIQVLPPFDNAYKKINLTFYITKLNIRGNQISISGSYKVPELTDVRYKCLGVLDTYNLFKQVAIETGLGFASNCVETLDDRYVYCDHISYLDLLNYEISISGSDETHLYDWWIDLWNNLTLANIYERYHTIEDENDMMIWMADKTYEILENRKISPIKVPAVFNNLPGVSQSELIVRDYEISNNPGLQLTMGTDKIYSCYVENLKEYKDTYFQDKDAHKDVWVNCEYLGEVFGDYNYLLSERCREAHLQKMNTETITINLSTPLLAITRGSKVNFAWYNNNSQLDIRNNYYKSIGVLNETQPTPGMDDTLSPQTVQEHGARADEFQKDESISGQYMVCGQIMNYSSGRWDYKLLLRRPHDQKTKLLKEDYE